MKRILFTLSLFALFQIGTAQETWNACNSTVTVIPAPSYDSTFVLSAPSRAALAKGMANWTPSTSSAASYHVYMALLNQGGTYAPTATVLENTLGGTVTWSYNDVGVYLATLSGAFPDSDKVFILIGNPDNASGVSFAGWIDANSILIQTTDETFTNANDRFYRAVIEIRVYP